MAGPVVVKIGGSLIGSPELKPLLAVAARRGAVVVPGGGRFADAVRAAQGDLGFSDRAAHAMAILAMDQTAAILAELEPALPLASSPSGLAAGRATWRPSPMALEADVPASWDVTSDSLALWLAIRLSSPKTILLKSADVAAGADLVDLARDGVVDLHLPQIARGYAGEVLVIGPATATSLEAALAAPERRAA